jgi:glycosyltransferase involved in cell wall biosynthesis
MNIGIDVTAIIYDRGVSRYTSNLVQALAERSDLHLSLYGSSLRQKDRLERFCEYVEKLHPHAHSTHVVQKIPPKMQKILWNTLGLNPIRKTLPDIDLFHSWDWFSPPDRDLPMVSTIHDVAMLKFPETAHPEILASHKKSWERLKKNNAHIIAVSHSTRKDVIELLNFDPQKVHVVYEALPREIVQVSEELTEERYGELRKNLELEKPFLLFVGTREPRKNLARIIEAWQPLSEKYQLLVAGEEGWDESSKKKTDPNVRFLGKVSHEELMVLYGEAEIFVYPSLYEGFGLPILEAFYHGTPVVTANTSSMPEVAGNAAELVDPLSVESIRNGLLTILNESREAQQKRLQRMIIRLQLFSWEKVAEQTIAVYKKVMEEAQKTS